MAVAALRPDQAGRVWRGALFDLVLWFGLVVLATLAIKVLTPSGHFGGWFIRLAAPIQMLALFVLSTVLLRRRGETWAPLGLRMPSSITRVAILVGLGFVVAITMNAIWVLLALRALGVARPDFGAFGVLKGHPWSYVFWLLYAWISAAVGEELQFRGFLFSRLERIFGGGRMAVPLALVGQAAVFGLGHIYQGVGGVLTTGSIGLVLGGVYLAGRRNLVACMLLHALIDTISLTILFLVQLPAH